MAGVTPSMYTSGAAAYDLDFTVVTGSSGFWLLPINSRLLLVRLAHI